MRLSRLWRKLMKSVYLVSQRMMVATSMLLFFFIFFFFYCGTLSAWAAPTPERRRPRSSIRATPRGC